MVVTTNRLASHALVRHLLDPSQLAPLLRTLRGVLFPNNAMGKPSLFPPEDEEGLLALRRRCASELCELVPAAVGRMYFGRVAGRVDSQLGKDKWIGMKTRKKNGEDAIDTQRQRGQQLQASTASSPRTAPSGGVDQMDIIGASTSSNRGVVGGRSTTGIGAEARAGTRPVGGDDTIDLNNEDLEWEGARGSDEKDVIISEIESGLLDVFSDVYCNKHLMYGALELILVRLMPELAEKGIAELWSERLG